jgi:outer membrane receptor protein involved in Fe transport
MKIKASRSSAGESTRPLRKPLAAAVAVACGTAMLVPATAPAQDSQLEEIVVTATKREEGVQDIPMAVMVLGEQQLQDLNIVNMEDYVQMLPNVSYVTLGPGSGNVYIRGISSGGESGIGANPSVAVYLDEQPVTAVGSFLNPHVYDVSRIEVLAGPQGTTFGANAQSGAIRIITNQPDPSGFSAGFTVDGNQPKSGDFGYLLEGFANFPINDRAAVRVVGYVKEEAGYIDNIAGTHTFSNANIRAGLDPSDPLNQVAADITIDNNGLVEENFNTATTIGGRAALRVDLNDAWTVTAGVIYQELESKGVWDHDPSLGDLVVQRWMPDWADDEWTQWSLKVEGEIAGGTLTATYADLDRDQSSANDYSLYTDYYVSYGFVQPYYSCYVTYFGQCEDPRESLTSVGGWESENFELRYASDPENRFRWMVGAFYTDVSNFNDGDWHVLGLANIPGSYVEEPDIYWTTNFRRNYEETAFFGEASFDFTDDLSASVSARTFEYEARLDGFSGTVWWPCGGFQPGHPDNNYGEGGCSESDRLTEGDDEVFRVSLDYQMNDDVMLYTSWGEGYRPGSLNRMCETRATGGLPGQGESNIGCAFRSDFLTSTEIGFKSTLLDGRMRINVSAYWQEWEDFQFSRLDTSISPLTLTFNVGNAEANGIDGDFTTLLTDDWTLSGAFSYIYKSELTSDYWRNPPDDPSDPGAAPPDAPSGTALPRIPEWKWNLTTRYSMQNDFYLQGAYMYTGDSYNTLFEGGTIATARRTQEAYGVLNAAFGLEKEDWNAELYVRNLTDERGDVWINAVTWDSRVTTNRPRTVGVTYRRFF